MGGAFCFGSAGEFAPAYVAAVEAFCEIDRLDRAVLEALCRRFGGGPVGLSTLAVAVGEEPDTVETVAEPYLVREGYMIRTPRGRAASPRAWTHLGLRPPDGHFTETLQLDTDDGGGRFTG